MYFIHVLYPKRAEELEVMMRTTGAGSAKPEHAMTAAELVEAHRLVREVPIGSHLVAYALDIVRATRPGGDEGKAPIELVKQYVEWGAGPRAAQYMVLGGKARALMAGRTHVTAEDLRAVAYPVLTHRVIVNFAAEADGVDSRKVIDAVLKHVAVPKD